MIVCSHTKRYLWSFSNVWVYYKIVQFILNKIFSTSVIINFSTVFLIAMLDF